MSVEGGRLSVDKLSRPSACFSVGIDLSTLIYEIFPLRLAMVGVWRGFNLKELWKRTRIVWHQIVEFNFLIPVALFLEGN